MREREREWNPRGFQTRFKEEKKKKTTTKFRIDVIIGSFLCMGSALMRWEGSSDGERENQKRALAPYFNDYSLLRAERTLVHRRVYSLAIVYTLRLGYMDGRAD